LTIKFWTKHCTSAISHQKESLAMPKGALLSSSSSLAEFEISKQGGGWWSKWLQKIKFFAYIFGPGVFTIPLPPFSYYLERIFRNKPRVVQPVHTLPGPDKFCPGGRRDRCFGCDEFSNHWCWTLQALKRANASLLMKVTAAAEGSIMTLFYIHGTRDWREHKTFSCSDIINVTRKPLRFKKPRATPTGYLLLRWGQNLNNVYLQSANVFSGLILSVPGCGKWDW